MRRGALVISILVAGLCAAPAAEARSSFCSPSGDYCTGVLTPGSAVKLRIATFSFRGRVRVCVDPPRGESTCKSFRLFERKGGIYESTVRWGRNFPRRGPGLYRVRWQKFGATIGPALSFRR